MPSRTFLRGRSASWKKAEISLARASGSRTSPLATTSAGRVWRAALTSLGLPLFTTTAAASSDAPMLSPTSCLCRPPEGVAELFRCFGARFGTDMFRFGSSVLGVSTVVVSASAFTDGLRLKETSFFRKSLNPLTVWLLLLGGRGGPRGGVRLYAVRRRCGRAGPRTPHAGS